MEFIDEKYTTRRAKVIFLGTGLAVWLLLMHMFFYTLRLSSYSFLHAVGFWAVLATIIVAVPLTIFGLDQFFEAGS